MKSDYLDDYNWDINWDSYKEPSRAEKWLIRKRHQVIKSLIRNNDKVLEIGCGYGSNSRLLQQQGFEVHCLDNSRTVVSKIKKDLPNAKFGDAKKLPYKDNTFNLVFSSGLLEHFRDPNKVIKEMQRVCKKGGIILNFVPGKYSLWQVYIKLTRKHGKEKAYTKEDLSKLAKNKEILYGGLDMFSGKGFLLKLIPLPKMKSSFTEIFSAWRK